MKLAGKKLKWKKGHKKDNVIIHRKKKGATFPSVVPKTKKLKKGDTLVIKSIDRLRRS
jgi:DNA invertase Pin-like site-specific DNA recombinase